MTGPADAGHTLGFRGLCNFWLQVATALVCSTNPRSPGWVRDPGTGLDRTSIVLAPSCTPSTCKPYYLLCIPACKATSSPLLFFPSTALLQHLFSSLHGQIFEPSTPFQRLHTSHHRCLSSRPLIFCTHSFPRPCVARPFWPPWNTSRTSSSNDSLFASSEAEFLVQPTSLAPTRPDSPSRVSLNPRRITIASSAAFPTRFLKGHRITVPHLAAFFV